MAAAAALVQSPAVALITAPSLLMSSNTRCPASGAAAVGAVVSLPGGELDSDESSVGDGAVGDDVVRDDAVRDDAVGDDVLVESWADVDGVESSERTVDAGVPGVEGAAMAVRVMVTAGLTGAATE